MPKKRTLVALAAIIFVVWLIRKYMKTPRFKSDGTRYWSVEEVKDAFKKVAQKYGTDYARKLEQLFRLEVGHWERKPSSQWTRTFSPGMVQVPSAKEFPYGWSSLKEFTDKNPQYRNGYYTVDFANTSAGAKSYVGFPSIEASVMFVAWFIRNKRNNRFGHWNSKDEAKASAYEQKMNTVQPKFN